MATRNTSTRTSRTATATTNTSAPVLEASYVLRTASSGATSARYVAENGSGRRDVEFYIPRANLEATGGLPRRVTITVTAEDGEPLPISVMDDIAALINAAKDLGVPYPEKAAGAIILRDYGIEHGTAAKDYAAVQDVFESCDWRDYAPVIKPSTPMKAPSRAVEARSRSTAGLAKAAPMTTPSRAVEVASVQAPVKAVPAPIKRGSLAKAAAASVQAPAQAGSSDARIDALEGKMEQLFDLLQKIVK